MFQEEKNSSKITNRRDKQTDWRERKSDSSDLAAIPPEFAQG